MFGPPSLCFCEQSKFYTILNPTVLLEIFPSLPLQLSLKYFSLGLLAYVSFIINFVFLPPSHEVSKLHASNFCHPSLFVNGKAALPLICSNGTANINLVPYLLYYLLVFFSCF